MRIGIDLGGTKIEGDRARRRAARSAFASGARRPAATTTAPSTRCVDLVAAAEAAIGQTATVGIGMPGAISPATGLVKNANSTWLIGRTLDRDLEARLGRPVRLANDANCFALSEASDGAAAGAPVVFGVIVGTGCGGGVVVARAGPHRSQRHRRRVGTQSPALARAPTNCRGPSATAASADASRRICRVRAWRATTPRARGSIPPGSRAPPSSRAPPPATATPSPRSTATPIGSRAAWPR